MSQDLFGEAPVQPLPLQIKRRRAGEPRGYPAMPGTGPEGKRCKHCANLVIRRLAKDYRKCGLMRAVWTGGRRTDIRANSPACSKFRDAAMSGEAKG